MCGINGIIGTNNIEEIKKRIENMNKSTKHRGPDSQDVKIISKKFGLGHNRLSILDTREIANQPMISESNRWIIVFNGEIYNYLELKTELAYNFKTDSDTEVILAYVEEFGVDQFFKVCNGMFALALYDTKNEYLYLARDRMGIKPLYYYHNDKYIIFSSEIKGILSSGLVNADFNYSAIDEYLGYRYIREPNTFFKNIYQLESGNYLKISNNMKIDSIKYWKLPEEFNFDKTFNEEKITKDFRSLIIDSIRLRLRSDVPLGTYLSGGVDSSLITALTSKLTNSKINTYTIGFDNLNEFEYSKIVSEKYKTNHHEINISYNNYFDEMLAIIKYKDAPLAVPNEVPLAIMSRKLKEKITVVLSGEGADELLGGYGKIFRSPFDYENHINNFDNFYEYFINKYEYVPRTIRDMFVRSRKPYRVFYDNILSKKFDSKSNEENVFRFFHNYHIKGLLSRVDTTTMLASVEARVPFVDHRLIEYSYRSIPYSLKLKWKDDDFRIKAKSKKASEYSEVYDIPKYLIRKISYEYLDKEIIERKKVGFPVPLNSWIFILKEKAIEYLRDADWFKYENIDDLFSEISKNPRSGQILWMFISLEMFRKEYFTKKWIY